MKKYGFNEAEAKSLGKLVSAVVSEIVTSASMRPRQKASENQTIPAASNPDNQGFNEAEAKSLGKSYTDGTLKMRLTVLQ